MISKAKNRTVPTGARPRKESRVPPRLYDDMTNWDDTATTTPPRTNAHMRNSDGDAP
jgi:hypothetical protein